MSAVLRSFPPVAGRGARVLVLGSMPGPEALRRRQYYGFPGNHFWPLIAGVLGETDPVRYPARLAMLRRRGVALWDVLASCTREGALDSAIAGARPNDVPGLLRRHPGIRAVFVNGRTAQAYLRRFHGGLGRPVFYLPSTSPANARGGVAAKRRSWRALRRWL
ncbi:MAG: DNA-deoxyinosine glycosylase [Elusimicrobia bacterium]|nr:DNA-deoxyinosine glycosylase [Elusimicrobiota bacterium]